ncbi:MAG: pseudaminic acid cytidylyltransferase, partial [Leptospiraceae bacterium]|nr:pseudaminic acid cytidylyltransferase [Leptospiraceae bacterium]
AAKAGASVPFFRSFKNSDDTATTAAVLVEVLGKTDGLRFSAACCIYPTAPLIRMESLERGLQILEENDFQCVFPVVPFGFSVWRGLRREGESIQPCWPENYLKRSQDLETIYHDAGQFYWFRPHDLTEQRTLMMNRTGSVLLSEMEVQDIDTESDWQLAELKYRLMHG